MSLAEKRRWSLSTSWLAQPWAYLAFQYLVGPHSRSRFLREYVVPRKEHSILDIGCGPGLLYTELRKLMGEVDYTGVDIDDAYVRSAQRRLGPERFRQGDVCSARPEEFGQYDRVVAYGLLHHLSDAEVEKFFAFAVRVVKPGGRIVTLDGTLVARQSRFARVVIALDRGQNIRAPEHYRLLAERHAKGVTLDVRHDLQAIPYSCAILITPGAGA
jgi:SAM-dependent methyltransferase